MERFLLWTELDYPWGDIKRPNNQQMIWKNISLIDEVERIIRGGSSYGDDSYREYVENNPWGKLNETIGKEKTDKFIKIFCTVNNIEYEKMIKVKEEVKVSVSQFEKVFNESTKVKVDFKNQYIKV